MGLVLRWVSAGGSAWRGTAERIARQVWNYRRIGSTFRRFADGSLLTVKYTGGDTVKLFLMAAILARYQFAGSFSRLRKTFHDPTLPGRYLPRISAVAVDQLRDKARPTALFSADLAPNPDSGLSWPARDDPRSADRFLRAAPFHQPDGAGFRQWFAAGAAGAALPWLMTGWQQARPTAGFGALSAATAGTFDTVDLGYDRSPTLFAGTTRGVRKSPQGSDWYGQACLLTVADRRFVIMVDATNTFYCYPSVGYGSRPIAPTHPGESGNVPEALIKTAPCPWPAWVTDEPCGQRAMDSGVPRAEVRSRLRPLWVFNRAGTRAACVAAHRAAPWADAYWRSEYPADDGTTALIAREDTPGLVEVAFDVAVIGPKPDDFTFAVHLTRELDSRTDARTPVAVGYLLRTVGAWASDSLVLLEYRHYTDLAELNASPGSPTGYDPLRDPPLYELHRPTRATVAVVSVLDEAGAWTEVRSWLAYYACYPLRADPRHFSPRIEDFPELATFAGQPDYANHFTYICQINAIDLGALAFCLSPTARTVGDVRAVDGHFVTYGAEAAGAVTYVWNGEVDRQLVGHPLLKDTCEALFDGGLPSGPVFSRLYCAATADSVPADPPLGDSPLESATRYCRLTLRDGQGGVRGPFLLTNADETGLLDFTGVRNTPALAGATELAAPRVFSYFDGLPMLRPGTRFAVGGPDLSLGESAYSGYPVGAIHHNSVVFLTLNALNALGNRFSAHPDGSWAIFAGPFAARIAVAAYYRDGVSLPLPALEFEQITVDRISLNAESRAADGTIRNRRVETSHRDALGTAFERPDLVGSYRFELRVNGTDVEFRPASNDPDAHGWYKATPLTPLGVGWTAQSITRRRCTSEFCFNPQFIEGKRYLSYNPFTTFPTPRLEGGFMAGAGV